MQGTSQGALHDALTRAFRQLTATFTTRSEVDPQALRRPDYALLAAVERHGSVRPSDLAAADGHDLSTISRRVASLEGRGWVVRERDPDDGRACRVALTDEGTTRLTTERAARAAIVTEVLVSWSEDDVRTLTDLLERMSDDVAASRPLTTHLERSSA